MNKVEKRWEQLTKKAESEGTIIQSKDTFFWRMLGKIVFLFGNKTFNTGFISTVGPFIAYPVGSLERHQYTANGCGTLTHELVHVKQFRCFGYVTLLLPALLYFMTFNPLLLATYLAPATLLYWFNPAAVAALMGVPLMALVYLLFPIPMGIALGRWWLERCAYVAGVKVEMELAEFNALSDGAIEAMSEHMTGGNYGYTMKWAPKMVYNYYEKHLGLNDE